MLYMLVIPWYVWQKIYNGDEFHFKTCCGISNSTLIAMIYFVPLNHETLHEWNYHAGAWNSVWSGWTNSSWVCTWTKLSKWEHIFLDEKKMFSKCLEHFDAMASSIPILTLLVVSRRTPSSIFFLYSFVNVIKLGQSYLPHWLIFGYGDMKLKPMLI